MREEILKILEMNKQGSLSDEQAAELLEALKPQDATKKNASGASSSQERAPQGDNAEDNSSWSGPFEGFEGPYPSDLGSIVSEAVNSSIDTVMNEVGSAYRDVVNTGTRVLDSTRNNFMSSTAAPTGENYHFDDNQFIACRIDDLHLDDCEMVDNRFHASRVQGLKFHGGSLRDTSTQGSSIEEMDLVESNLNDLSFKGTKIAKLHVKDSNFQDLSFQGAAFKATKIIDSIWSDISWSGSAINQSSFLNTRISDANISKCSIKGTTLDGWELRDVRLKNVTLSNCEISNVHLTDMQIKNVRLNGKTASSTEEFLALIEAEHNS